MLILDKFYLVEHFIYFLGNNVVVYAFKSCVELKMLADSQVVEKHIVLWADA